MNDKTYVPFPAREGLVQGPPIEGDFPNTARVALLHCLEDLVERGAIRGDWIGVCRELQRLTREKRPLPDADSWRATRADGTEAAGSLLAEAPWEMAFYFCERLYQRLLQAIPEWDHRSEEQVGELESLEEVRQEFTDEIATILLEENLAWRFNEGLFYRPGGKHLRQVARGARLVLARPELEQARRLYEQALDAFHDRNASRLPAAALDALRALEAAARALFSGGKNTSFSGLINSLKGSGENEIPPALASSMKNLFDMRGSLAHGGRDGGNIDANSAEFILSQVAASITYLAALSDARSRPAPF